MNSFEENLKTAFSESQYMLCMKNGITYKHYQRLEKEYNQLFDLIRSKLGKRNRKLMLKLEALGNAKDSIEDDLVFFAVVPEQ